MTFAGIYFPTKAVVTAGYFAAVLIGIALGLIGGGGSILTVPVLVYLFGMDAAVATVYSLFIVGTTSAAGSISYITRRLVQLKTVLFFGLPSIPAVYLTRTYLVPALPDTIFSIGTFTVMKSGCLMLLFAVLMLFASYKMIRKSPIPEKVESGYRYPQMILQGLLVGSVTGLIGAGGGFLIIPALVHFLKLPMKAAVGTSLAIIALNSLSGFVFSLGQLNINWTFLLALSGIALIGILIGSYLSTRIDGKTLKPAFGWFVLVMGLYILLRETLLS